jgi:hypothetical protein
MRLRSLTNHTTLGDQGENLASVLKALCVDSAKKQTLIEWIQALTPMDAQDFEFYTHPYTLKHAALIYRLSDQLDSRIKRILEIPFAPRVIEKQNISLLHASGWFEDVMELLEEEATE